MTLLRSLSATLQRGRCGRGHRRRGGYGAVLMVLGCMSGALGCSDQTVPSTAVLVAVHSDLELGVQLSALEVEIQTADGRQPHPDSRPFELSTRATEVGRSPLPLSFGVVRAEHGADRFRIVLRGKGPLGADGAEVVVIEQTAIVTFHSQITQRLTMFLSNVCFQNLCEAGADQTCYPAAQGNTLAGECGPVQEATLSPVQPGRELDGLPGLDAGPAANDAGDMRPSEDAARDGGAAADSAPNGGSDAAQDAGSEAARNAVHDAAPPAESVRSDGGDSGLAQDAGSDARTAVDASALSDRCANGNGGCGDAVRWRCSDLGGAAPVCTDIDECATANGGCEQSCQNDAGSFSCACTPGYVLEANARTCRLRSWGKATLIYQGITTLSAQVTVDGSGNAIAIWSQDANRFNAVVASRFVPGSGWGAEIQLQSDTASSFGGAPKVAADASGNAFAVWDQGNGTGDHVWVSRFAVSGGWGTATSIETGTGDLGDPQIAVNKSGDAVVVWQQSDGTRANIWANRFVVGTGWTGAALIETDNAGSAGGPQVAIDGAGNATVVWYQSDGTRNNIWANRFVVGGSWGTASLIESNNAGDAVDPQVVVDGLGNAIAVWRQSDGVRDNIWSSRFAGGGWSTPAMIERDNAGSALGPQVAVAASGDAVAVWYQSDGTRNKIWSNRFVVGSGWAVPTSIESDNARDAVAPKVAVDGSGNAVAVWRQSSDTGSDILANRFVVGSGWGTATPIDDGEYPDAPQVVLDGAGNAVAVWAEGISGSPHAGHVGTNRFE